MRKLALAASAALALLLGAARGEVNLQNIDPTVKPQDDFFHYADGTWLKTVAIPADQSRWGSFDDLDQRNVANLHAICERVAALPAGATPIEKMVGDFYASGMDEPAINAAGIQPLQPDLDRIAAIKTPAGVLATIAHLKSAGSGVAFGFFASPDAKDSNMNLAQLRQGGLGLPDRDYYFTDDEKSQKIRQQYVAHVAKMLQLLGDNPEVAQVGAQSVLRLETLLAQASLARIKLRNPYASYHKLPVAELAKTTGDLDWGAFFTALGTPAFKDINLAHPEFFKAFAAQLTTTPLADWQAYLRWHLIHESAPYLNEAVVKENFSFYGTIMSGVKEMKPRWKRVVAVIDGEIGEALGQLYVAAFFPPEAKVRVLKLVADLRAALREDLQTLQWMDEATRTKAIAKLDAFRVKMGYPDKWKDYSSVKIDRVSYLANVRQADAFDTHRNYNKIGQPVDKTEWGMTPPTVNASYSPTVNGITFPAGILQPPFFDPKADDAVNFGGIGVVIGHEMTHGFDDRGRQYDANGNLIDWWTPASAEKFKARAAGIVQQFSGYTVLDGLHLKGELTQGENIADLGGLKISYAAMQKALAGKPREKIDGFTPEQRFFLSHASVWRDLMRPEEQRRRVNIDPHSPGMWRVNGPLSNLDEFAQAFDVPEGAPMRRPAAERVSIW
jgi:predicted metalloendopeptidase